MSKMNRQRIQWPKKQKKQKKKQNKKTSKKTNNDLQNTTKITLIELYEPHKKTRCELEG